MPETILKKEEIDTYINRCIGLPVTDVWKGVGTAIFLELGKLHAVKNKKNEPMRSRGDISLMIEWHWRIEDKKSIIAGSLDPEERIALMINSLLNKRVEYVSIVGRLPEIYLGFSGNLWLHSFTFDERQPEWGILFYDEGNLEVKNGKVCFISE